MGRIPQNIKTRINLNKHLEKSKCFFRAQKGVKHVHLGMDSNRFRVVGILIAGIFYLFVYKQLKQRD